MTPYQQGKAAANRREPFPDFCPYSFQRAGVSVDEFNAKWRKNMDEWFRGWKDQLDSEGLGLSFKPLKQKD
mgnify:FL=1